MTRPAQPSDRPAPTRPARSTLATGATLLAAFCAQARAGDELPDAATLLDAARAALVDDGAWDCGRVLHLEGTSRWKGLDGEGTVEEWIRADGAGRRVTNFEPYGHFVLGSDGTQTVWESNSLGVTVREGVDAAQYRRAFELMRQSPWREVYLPDSARCTGRAVAEGQDCWVLELTPRLGDCVPDGAHDTWYVSVESGLPVRQELRAGEVSLMVLLPSDWRAVDGVRYAHELGLEVSGFTLVTNYDRIEHADAAPADAFVPGDDVLASLERERSGRAALEDDEIRVEELEERHIASIRMTCPHAEMKKNLGVLLPEVMRHVMASGVRMAGQPLVRYHAFGEPIDMEAAIPLEGPIEPAGRMTSETLPAGRAVVAWHVGPYDTLGQTYERLMAYMQEHRLVARAACWEEYMTDPGMEPDPSRWRTLVVWPVKDAP